jgi:hypothetical protein
LQLQELEEIQNESMRMQGLTKKRPKESSWPNDYKKGVSCLRQSPSLSFAFETFSCIVALLLDWTLCCF